MKWVFFITEVLCGLALVVGTIFGLNEAIFNHQFFGYVFTALCLLGLVPITFFAYEIYRSE